MRLGLARKGGFESTALSMSVSGGRANSRRRLFSPTTTSGQPCLPHSKAFSVPVLLGHLLFCSENQSRYEKSKSQKFGICFFALTIKANPKIPSPNYSLKKLICYLLFCSLDHTFSRRDFWCSLTNVSDYDYVLYLFQSAALTLFYPVPPYKCAMM